MSVVSMKQLLEAGVHFGHQTRRWNPKMSEYIFTERNGIHIIDLQKTVKKIEEAYMFVRDTAAAGGTVFCFCRQKSRRRILSAMRQSALICFTSASANGGMLTNFKTIKKSIQRLRQIEKMEEDGTFELLPKKEVLGLPARKGKF